LRHRRAARHGRDNPARPSAERYSAAPLSQAGAHTAFAISQ